MPLQHAATYDNALLLKASGAVTSDTAESTILDLGAGRVDAAAFLNVSAIDVAGGDEHYVISVQGSNSSSFASGVVNLASLILGDSTLTKESADSVVGLYELPFTTEKLGTVYRYVRIQTEVIAGATASVTFSAYAVKQAGA